MGRRKMVKTLHMQEAKCRNCGKNFLMPDGSGCWAYRDRNLLYCTNRCMNQYRRENPEMQGIQQVTRRYLNGLAYIMGYFGLTAEQVSGAVGMSKKVIYEMMSGLRKAKLPETLKLCGIFGCTEDDLYGYVRPDKGKMALWEIRWELLDGTDEK